jgi:hypothetical protein
MRRKGLETVVVLRQAGSSVDYLIRSRNCGNLLKARSLRFWWGKRADKSNPV